MTFWGWITNRLARLRAYLRLAWFYLRAESLRSVARWFRAKSRINHAADRAFETMSEAMASSDWSVLSAALTDQPDFPNRPDPLSGIPWFHIAVELGTPDVIAWMIEHGANLDYFDSQGYNALSYASFREEDVAKVSALLIKSGADVHACDVIGNTALHVAAASGREPAVRALLKGGADPVAYNSDTLPATPIHLAERAGHTLIVEILKSASQSTAHGNDKGL